MLYPQENRLILKDALLFENDFILINTSKQLQHFTIKTLYCYRLQTKDNNIFIYFFTEGNPSNIN